MENGKRIPTLNEGEYQEAFKGLVYTARSIGFHESHDRLLENTNLS